MSKELIERLTTVVEGFEAGIGDWPIASQIWEYRAAIKAIEQQAAQIEAILNALEGAYDYVEEAISRRLEEYGENFRPERLAYMRSVKSEADKALSITPSDALQQVKDRIREDCAESCEQWGNEQVKKWEGDDEMGDDAKARAWDALMCAAAIRSLKGQP